jgi:hypothetical protein
MMNPDECMTIAVIQNNLMEIIVWAHLSVRGHVGVDDRVRLDMF